MIRHYRIPASGTLCGKCRDHAVEKHKIVPTTSPKKVHIIGGGIGGMEAARVLKLRGHEPVIHEQTDHLAEPLLLPVRKAIRENCGIF